MRQTFKWDPAAQAYRRVRMTSATKQIIIDGVLFGLLSAVLLASLAYTVWPSSGHATDNPFCDGEPCTCAADTTK